MRWIANLIITGLILWGMSMIFPNQVYIDGFWKIALAAFGLWAIELIIQLICSGLILVGAIAATGGGCFLVVIAAFAAMFSKVIALSILDSSLAGFTMKGFWLKLLTATVCSILCFRRYHYYDDEY